ncbi:porin [Trinickia fusca]|uniref:Porin n=1 Tax=Trinickia fusca TaxID=2419777 RepID=A0A494XJ27_9BURK|nr:porin [Trinickia fusca]RKP50737.1 porin [Trinickia fusca]
MKKTLLVGALTGVFATMAHAQSSVTLYGLIDAGITYTNNQGGHANWQQSSGTINGSRWGIRGSEDLGGGLKAIFVLENGFKINDGSLGQGSREFGRQAFVGLASDQFGSVTLGRQYDSVVDYLAPLSATGTQYGGTQFAHPFDNDNLNNTFRVNNAVKFSSANYAGLKFGGLYSFSNTAGQFANNRLYSFGASYNYGGLNVAAAYLQLDNDNPTTVANANASGSVVNDSQTLMAGRQRTYGAGVNYTFGPATAGVVITQTRLSNATQLSAGGVKTSLGGNSVRFTNYEVNGRYMLTPALSLSAAYTYTAGRIGGQSPNWNQFSLQTDYLLSKRTDVYLSGEFQHVAANGTGVTAEINNLAASSNSKQVVVNAGIRHRF